MNIENEIKKWAITTCDYYNTEPHIAGFYTQSNLNYIKEDGIELMIIGINPGSDSEYCYKTYEELLIGNGEFETKADEEWVFWKKLKNVFSYGNALDLISDKSKYVFTNATLYATNRESQLSSLDKNQLIGSYEYTKKLIDILKPKRIICLGGKNCIDKLFKQEFKDNLIIYTGKNKNLYSNIAYLKYNEIPVYGINHTSALNSYQEMEILGRFLGLSFKMETIRKDELNEQNKNIVESYMRYVDEKADRKLAEQYRWSYILKEVVNYCIYELNLQECDHKFDWYTFFIDEERLQVIRINTLVGTKDVRLLSNGKIMSAYKIVITNNTEEIIEGIKVAIKKMCL